MQGINLCIYFMSVVCYVCRKGEIKMDIPDFLKDFIDKELASEGITPELLNMVDLDIAYSPVIPYKGAEPCKVSKRVGGKYLVEDEIMISNNTAMVTKDSLKIMRLRYLLQREQDYKPLMEQLKRGLTNPA